MDVTSLQFFTFHKGSFNSIRETFNNEKNLLNSKFLKSDLYRFPLIEYGLVQKLLLIITQCVNNKLCFWQLNFAKCLMIIVKLELYTTVFFHHFYIKNVGQCFYRQSLTWIHEVIEFQSVFFLFAIIKSYIAILINFYKLFKI